MFRVFSSGIDEFKNGVDIYGDDILFIIIYSIMTAVITIMVNKRIRNRKIRRNLVDIFFIIILIIFYISRDIQLGIIKDYKIKEGIGQKY